MTTFNTEAFDNYGRQIKPIVGNSSVDGSGTFYFPVVGSDGYLHVALENPPALASDAGIFTTGRAVTATLRVSPDGDGNIWRG